MIKRMYHTGFVVSDLQKSLAFYRDVLGLKVVRELERTGYPISQVVGYENAHLKGAMLGLEGEEGHVLELIQYVNPKASARPTTERAVLGGSHLAFYVDDIEQTFQKLVANGAKKLNPPVEIAPGRKGCYMQDPDGNWIELIQQA
ncbi:MAG: VOC family protein [Chloroflexi bacterium]|nr:VOC family protein [Chloroflexota bacterium]